MSETAKRRLAELLTKRDEVIGQLNQIIGAIAILEELLQEPKG